MSNNANLPRLFDDKGHLIEVDPSTMDAATRERHAAVVKACRANEEAKAELAAAQDGVTAALRAVDEAEAFHDRHWPRQSYHDLWRENFGGGPRNRMTALGMLR
jgi:hypothetical protein